VHNNQIAREYARAIMQFAPDKYDQIISFFGKIADYIVSSATFANLLNHPVISSGEKFKAVMSLSDGPLPNVIDKVILDLVSRRGITIVSIISSEMGRIFKASLHIKDASVFSAKLLSEKEKQSMTEAIGVRCGLKVNVSFFTDSTLLAGYKVKIGDTVYDNTVRRQLQMAGDILSFTNRV
jgi:F-type H+-transporting ATPase subunit delta